MNMVNFIAEKIGHGGDIEQKTITIRNRGGHVIGYAKGFFVVHCTFSYADGPGTDYSKAFSKWLKGLDFEIENSYGETEWIQQLIGMIPIGRMNLSINHRWLVKSDSLSGKKRIMYTKS